MAAYYLTRRAARDLKHIHQYSLEKWGTAVAKIYIQDLYTALGKAAELPQVGGLRAHRSAPFRMLPAREHFIVFEPFQEGILALTILHQVRDVESVIASLEVEFVREIEKMGKRFPRDF
jgi:plasmid stabilization system protein ParE